MKHLILLGVLLREAGRIEGRKKFQKIVHILQEGGVDFEASFEFSRFGPYSSDLKSWIDELVQGHLFSETDTGNGFHYEITDTFRALLSKVGPLETPKWKPLLTELNQFDSSDLEGISTIIFLKSRGWEGEELHERFAALKKHLAAEFSRYAQESERIQRDFQFAA